MATHPLDALAGDTSRQYQHFATWQARAAGVSKHAIRRLKQRGLIERVHPDVYRLTSAGAPGRRS